MVSLQQLVAKGGESRAALRGKLIVLYFSIVSIPVYVFSLAWAETRNFEGVQTANTIVYSIAFVIVIAGLLWIVRTKTLPEKLRLILVINAFLLILVTTFINAGSTGHWYMIPLLLLAKLVHLPLNPLYALSLLYGAQVILVELDDAFELGIRPYNESGEGPWYDFVWNTINKTLPVLITMFVVSEFTQALRNQKDNLRHTVQITEAVICKLLVMDTSGARATLNRMTFGNHKVKEAGIVPPLHKLISNLKCYRDFIPDVVMQDSFQEQLTGLGSPTEVDDAESDGDWGSLVVSLDSSNGSKGRRRRQRQGLEEETHPLRGQSMQSHTTWKPIVVLTLVARREDIRHGGDHFVNEVLRVAHSTVKGKSGEVLLYSNGMLVCVWGFSGKLPSDAHNHACRAALDINQELQKSVDFGVCSGNARVGNVGSNTMMLHPDVIGDVLHLSNALARLNPLLGTTILCDRVTKDAVRLPSEWVERVVYDGSMSDVYAVVDSPTYLFDEGSDDGEIRRRHTQPPPGMAEAVMDLLAEQDFAAVTALLAEWPTSTTKGRLETKRVLASSGQQFVRRIVTWFHGELPDDPIVR